MEEYRDQMLKYLFTEKKLEEEEVEKQKQMSMEEKVENDILLIGITISTQESDVYELNVPDNYSKLRAGDKITIREEESSFKADATIIDVFFDTITISCEKQLDANKTFSIEQQSPALIQTLISCIEGIYSGVPGASFLRLLSGKESFEIDDFLKVDLAHVPAFDAIKSKMNDEQILAVEAMLEYPPVHVLQGPPGTGKTMVLASTALATARMNREVVIIANTHQAVNNALQKIRSLDDKVVLIKVGAKLKSEGLDKTILNFEKFGDYYEYSYKNRKKKRTGHIIGMTIWGAVTYLGLRHHAHFRPYQALVDEASLMPLTLGAILGKTAPSVCLFGDSRQMPPIFKQELASSPFSVSILDYCAKNIKGVPISVLHTTYRMNEEITSFVSKHYYEPYGISLQSSDYSKDRKLELRCLERFQTDDSIIHVLVQSDDNEYTDYNPVEASQVISLVKSMLAEGLPPNEIAVITPFRKQVRALREAAIEILGDSTCILIDTVERLQGQDVDCILISFAATNKEWIQGMKSFIFNPNRLNVMISRAKRKVLLFESEALHDLIKTEDLV